MLQEGTTYLSKVLQLFNDGEAFSTHIALVGRKHTARLDAGVMSDGGGGGGGGGGGC
jgi:hypothetical protein